MHESTIVALALAIGGLIGALFAMLYRETITKRLDKFETLLIEMHACFHRLETRMIVVEVKEGMQAPHDL